MHDPIKGFEWVDWNKYEYIYFPGEKAFIHFKNGLGSQEYIPKGSKEWRDIPKSKEDIKRYWKKARIIPGDNLYDYVFDDTLRLEDMGGWYIIDDKKDHIDGEVDAYVILKPNPIEKHLSSNTFDAFKGLLDQ